MKKYLFVIVIILLPNLSFGQTLIDSYSESNQDSVWDAQSSLEYGLGQCFTISGGDKVLGSAKWYLKKTGSPTGNLNAKIYATTGSCGTTGVHTGSVLATSDNLDVSTLTGSLALYTFTFSGVNRITLSNSTTYSIVVVQTSGSIDASNRPQAGYDGSSATHAGNLFTKEASDTAYSGFDTIFYVYSYDATPTPTPGIASSSSSYEDNILASDVLFKSIILMFLSFIFPIWYFNKKRNDRLINISNLGR